MLGDVVGQSGCEAVRALLPGLRRDYRADAVIVNGALTISHKRHTGAAAGRMLRRDEK